MNLMPRDLENKRNYNDYKTTLLKEILSTPETPAYFLFWIGLI